MKREYFMLCPLIRSHLFYFIYQEVIIFILCLVFKCKEIIHLTSARCEFQPPSTDLRGLGGSHAINCGGVLSIRMNNLKGMLIGIPDLAKGTETKCC